MPCTGIPVDRRGRAFVFRGAKAGPGRSVLWFALKGFISVPGPRGDATTTAPISGATAHQVRWLGLRLGTGSDAQASRALNAARTAGEPQVTAERLNVWRRNPSFQRLLDLCVSQPEGAFRALASSRAGLALRALDSLLQGESASERKEGVRLYLEILRGVPAQEDQAAKLFEVLREPASVRVLEVYQRSPSEGRRDEG